MILIASTTAQLTTIASQIITFAGNEKIFLFHGDMGAGKTTLIKSLCECLGITDAVTSPTFALVNEYIGARGKIYHFDFYRTKNQTEALDMGCEEYFYSGNHCFIEWPEKVPDMLPGHYISISIKVLNDDSREIIVEKI